MVWLWVLLALVAVLVVIHFGWRHASRHRNLPCPSLFAWFLESRTVARLSGTETTLDRMKIQPGERVLEIGPGPGRLLIPAAKRALPGGEVVGLDIQRGMLERLKARAARAAVMNLSVIHGDAAQPHVTPESFDLVFLCTVLGEIPEREAALAQCFAALRHGGRLAITELIGDPHYQSRATVDRLAREAGFEPSEVQGGWWFFTAVFVKP